MISMWQLVSIYGNNRWARRGNFSQRATKSVLNWCKKCEKNLMNRQNKKQTLKMCNKMWCLSNRTTATRTNCECKSDPWAMREEESKRTHTGKQRVTEKVHEFSQQQQQQQQTRLWRRWNLCWTRGSPTALRLRRRRTPLAVSNNGRRTRKRAAILQQQQMTF